MPSSTASQRWPGSVRRTASRSQARRASSSSGSARARSRSSLRPQAGLEVQHDLRREVAHPVRRHPGDVLERGDVPGQPLAGPGPSGSGVSGRSITHGACACSRTRSGSRGRAPRGTGRSAGGACRRRCSTGASAPPRAREAPGRRRRGSTGRRPRARAASPVNASIAQPPTIHHGRSKPRMNAARPARVERLPRAVRSGRTPRPRPPPRRCADGSIHERPPSRPGPGGRACDVDGVRAERGHRVADQHVVDPHQRRQEAREADPSGWPARSAASPRWTLAARRGTRRRRARASTSWSGVAFMSPTIRSAWSRLGLPRIAAWSARQPAGSSGGRGARQHRECRRLRRPPLEAVPSRAAGQPASGEDHRAARDHVARLPDAVGQSRRGRPAPSARAGRAVISSRTRRSTSLSRGGAHHLVPSARPRRGSRSSR